MMKIMIIAAVGVAAVAIGVAFAMFPSGDIVPVNTNTQSNGESGTNSNPIVPMEKIVSGGPPRDGIPSIDDPKFVRAGNASFMQEGDIIIGLRHNEVTKAYPLKILVWHEIVNDEIAGLPVAVTYCPLCFTSMVFDRTIDDNVVEFGTSGKLYNSNLVMYDRTSETLWSQAMAKGIVGEYSGYDLERVPFDLAYWKDWKQLYPNTLVLSTDTGSTRPYGVDPYGDYYTSSQIFFPIEHRDDRLGPKQLVIGLEQDGNYKAYALDDLERQEVVNDSIGEREIVLVTEHPFMVRTFDRAVDGQVLEFKIVNEELQDIQTSSEWNLEGKAISGPMTGEQLERIPVDPSFWFSWAAFHPETSLYRPN